MKVLLNELPWKEVDKREVLSDFPGIEIEVDGDKKTIRVYRILRDVFEKQVKKSKRVGNRKLWFEKSEVKE